MRRREEGGEVWASRGQSCALTPTLTPGTLQGTAGFSVDVPTARVGTHAPVCQGTIFPARLGYGGGLGTGRGSSAIFFFR